MNTGDAADISGDSERKLPTLFDKVGFALALSNPTDGSFVDVNDAWVNTFGYTRQEAIGKTTRELNINPDSEIRTYILDQLQKTDSIRDLEIKLRTRSGEWRSFLTNIDLVRIGGETYLLNTAQDITERKRAEQQLEQNNRKLNEILSSIQDDFYVLDRNWKFVYASKLFTAKIGKEPEDFIGNNIWEMFPKHLGTIYEENLRATMEKREVRHFEIPGRYTNAWYRMRVFPSDEGITVLGTDITERRQAEEQLRYQAALLSNVNDAIVASDAEYRITVWNAAAESLYGWKAEEVLGRSGVEIVRTEWPEKDADEMRRTIAESGHWRGEAIQQRKDGSRFPVEVSSIVLHDENHKVTGYVSVNRDITEHKKSEEALRLNAIMMDNMPAGVYLVRASDGTILYTNPTFDRLFGYQAGELIGKHVSVINAPTERSPLEVAESIIKALEQHDYWQGEVYSIRKDGTSFWASASVTMFEHATYGRVWVAARQDISARKQAEEALRARMEEIETLLDVSPIAIFVSYDPECARITGNPAAYQLLEMPGASDANVSKSAPVDERPTYRTFRNGVEVATEDLPMQKAARLGVDIHEDALELQFESGTQKFLYAFAKPLFDSTGKVRGAIAAMMDITERTRTEIVLRKNEKELQLLNETLEQKVQEKTAEVRNLASNLIRAEQRERQRISHILHDDLQQRIYVIQMKLTFLKDDLKKEQETSQQTLSEIEQRLREILTITRHLSIDISPPILHDEGLTHAIDWLIAQMLQRYGLVIELRADEPFAIPDAELHVLLFNCTRELLFNVVKHAHASQAVVSLGWSDSNLCIEVSDNGKGFPVDANGESESEAHGVWSNYGLPSIRQQLSLFGGRLEIHSEAEKGTRIVLTVPVVESAKEHHPS